MIKGVKLFFKLLSIMLSIFATICLVMFFVMPMLKIKPYVVLSGSMEPTIHTGAVAWINGNDTDVNLNDVVTFKLDDEILVTHRVVRVEQDGFITKGDNNDTEDFIPVSQDQIVGKYLFSIAGLGILIKRLQGNKILSICCLIFALAVIFMDIILSSSDNDDGGEK